MGSIDFEEIHPWIKRSGVMELGQSYGRIGPLEDEVSAALQAIGRRLAADAGAVMLIRTSQRDGSSAGRSTHFVNDAAYGDTMSYQQIGFGDEFSDALAKTQAILACQKSGGTWSGDKCNPSNEAMLKASIAALQTDCKKRGGAWSGGGKCKMPTYAAPAPVMTTGPTSVEAPPPDTGGGLFEGNGVLWAAGGLLVATVGYVVYRRRKAS